jgi:multidrug efflux pump subunit AcrA (membrane-fusion protein)
MSTEQVDPQLVEETKQQIRSLVGDIARLAKSELAPEQFFGQFLDRIIEALAAVGGAVWLRTQEGNLELKYQNNLREARLHESQENQARHGKILYQVLTSGEGALIAPHSGAGGHDEGASNPTDYLLVLGPLKSDQQTEGVVEIFQRHGAKSNTQRGYLRFVLQMCELAGEYLKTRQLRNFTDRQALWNQLDNFTRIAHASLDPRETAYTIANEGRRLIDCDRVSVAIRKGRKCYIEAVSGQDTFDKRSNTISLLNRLATAVVASGDSMWYMGDTTNMAPQVEVAVQEYVDDSHSKTVAVLPLRRPKPDPEEDRDRDLDDEPIGALIIEQIEDARPKEGLLQRVDVVSNHSSTALANALEHQNLFLMPVWRALGKAKWMVQARTLPKTIAVCVAVVSALLALWLVPADFELKGDGALEPVIQREVFAKVSGDILDVQVEHADMVQVGTPLVKMRSTDLDLKIEDLEGRKNTSLKRILQLTNQRRSAREQPRGMSESDERLQLVGELRIEEEKLSSVNKQLELLYQEKENLTVNSPMAGQVLTPWDALENLVRRPVERGTALMTIADPTGEWELKVDMSEDRMGHIARAQKELGKDLRVTYVLATDPGTKHEGKIREINTRAEVRGEEKGNTVLIRVQIDKNDLKYLRPKAGVKVKVYAGRCSIGYKYLHDAIAWVQRFKFDWL